MLLRDDNALTRARAAGAGNREIHDTVLIAAAFCMFSRYVDGLATWAPAEQEAYRETGVRLAEIGYAATPAMLAEQQATSAG